MSLPTKRADRIDMIERRQAERRALDEKRRGEETAYLKHQAKHLDLFLKVRRGASSHLIVFAVSTAALVCPPQSMPKV